MVSGRDAGLRGTVLLAGPAALVLVYVETVGPGWQIAHGRPQLQTSGAIGRRDRADGRAGAVPVDVVHLDDEHLRRS